MADSSRHSSSSSATATGTATSSASNPPCGACKFLRRKCVAGCIFAPHFSSDQGSARFAAVHKVFGASNVSKLLLRISPNRRHEAVVTVCYEAQARLADPVYGCVSTIMSLQHQVAALQGELGVVQSQLMNSRYALASAVQNSQQQPNMNMGLLHQPPAHAYSNSNNSCATSSTTNLMNMTSFISPSGFDLAAAMDAPPPPPSSLSLDPLQFSRLSQDNEEEDEQESRIPHHVFINHDNILHP